MLAVNIFFTAGRYSATPWGRQANEGIPEWPPSPWRFLRALVAAWQRAMPEVGAAAVAALLKALAEPPEYLLPPWTEGHTRHYMPLVEGKTEARTLIFDAFIALPRDVPLILSWPNLTLAQPNQALLAALLERLPYFGRAESWCRAEVRTAALPSEGEWCRVHVPTELPPPDMEFVQVLAADATEAAGQLLSRLMVETAARREQRRDPYRPPGSGWLSYSRPRRSSRPSRPVHLDAVPTVTVARYGLSGKVLPLAKQAVQLGDIARRAAMSQYGRLAGSEESRSPILSGKDAAGRPLQGHRHAFYLPADEDEDGFLDHLHICLRPDLKDTFSARDVRALTALRTLHGLGDFPIDLTLLYLGPRETLSRGSKLLGTGTTWRSVTPYVTPRHPKPAHGGGGWRSDGPEDQVRRELTERFGARVGRDATIVALPTCKLRAQEWSWQTFLRRRVDLPPPYTPGHGWRIHSPTAISGPLALGYSCHFGLGQFRLDEDGAA